MTKRVTTSSLISAAERRGWSVEDVHEVANLMIFTDTNGRRHLLRSLASEKSSFVHSYIADNKDITYDIAANLGVRIPKTAEFVSISQATEFLQKNQKIVVKPSNAAHGNGVTTGIVDPENIMPAVELARKYSDKILLQEHCDGVDYRLLYIGGKFAAGIIRYPAQVIGDGLSNIKDLITAENNRPERGESYTKSLCYIDSVAATKFLGEDNMKFVPNKDQAVVVVGTSNLGTGGWTEDCTDNVPEMAIKNADIMIQKYGFMTCAIDFMVSDSGEAVLIEVNFNPSIGLHLSPHKGKSQPVDELFLDWLES